MWLISTKILIIFLNICKNISLFHWAIIIINSQLPTHQTINIYIESIDSIVFGLLKCGTVGVIEICTYTFLSVGIKQ